MVSSRKKKFPLSRYVRMVAMCGPSSDKRPLQDYNGPDLDGSSHGGWKSREIENRGLLDKIVEFL